MGETKALIRVLTGCNIKCRHCYVSANDFKNEQFAYGRLQTVIDKLADFGTGTIIFTGGQPTLAGQDLFDIIKYSSEKREKMGYPKSIEITTNSILGKDEDTANYWISSFKDAGLDRIRLSADEYHREFLPKEYEDRIIDIAKEYGLPVKLMEVVSPQNRIDMNVDTKNKKTFALRPGGRAYDETLSLGWDNTQRCRIAEAYSHEKEETSLFIHPTGDVYTCNVGVSKELSLGNLFLDDLETILYGQKDGALEALIEGDVAGLGQFLGYDEIKVNNMINAYGRCGACSKLRESNIVPLNTSGIHVLDIEPGKIRVPIGVREGIRTVS